MNLIILDVQGARVRLVNPGCAPVCSHAGEAIDVLTFLHQHIGGTRSEMLVRVCGVPVDADHLVELLEVAGITYRAMRADVYPLRAVGEVVRGPHRYFGLSLTDGRVVIEMFPSVLRKKPRAKALPDAPLGVAGAFAVGISAPGGFA